MREFDDRDGVRWRAEVAERDGPNYKGRYHLVMTEIDGAEVVALEDVRWNSERTADRTLATMSEVELRRRLRSARGRAPR
jgi:hypothetical protein